MTQQCSGKIKRIKYSSLAGIGLTYSWTKKEKNGKRHIDLKNKVPCLLVLNSN
jgi:hypothetical protein